MSKQALFGFDAAKGFAVKSNFLIKISN